MSFSYSRYDRQQRRPGPSQRTALNYWIPLGVTVAAAAAGFFVWAWNERRSDEYEESSSDDGHDDPYAPPRRTQQAAFGGQRQSTQGTARMSVGETETLEVRDQESINVESESQDAGTLYGRMSGAIRRTPSPQQIFDGASRRMAAGVAAAGAVVGRGLSTLKESDEDFQDHERWSAEAESRSRSVPALGATQQAQKRKRMVAVVVDASSKDGASEYDPEYEIEHASLLSHLPLHIDSSAVDLIVLIYAPELMTYPLVHNTTTPTGPFGSLPNSLDRKLSTASSFSNISASGAVITPQEEREDLSIIPPAPEPPTPTSEEAHSNLPAAYAHLQQRALRLVPHPTHIIPFTSPTGHIHLLRHLAPSLVYIQESLCGSSEAGENVKQIEGWAGQVVVVVGGDGLGADTETETEDEGRGEKARVSKAPGGEWWKDERRVGLGRTEVVEGWRFEDDWMKRVGP